MIGVGEMKLVQIIISWNEERGFYHNDISGVWLSDVIQAVAIRYDLKMDFSKPRMSEHDWLLMVNGMNANTIRLQEEDGSDWKW